MQAAARIARDNRLIASDSTASYARFAVGRGERQAEVQVQVPALKRFVPRGGNYVHPIRHYRYAKDGSRVAFQRSQHAAANREPLYWCDTYVST